MEKDVKAAIADVAEHVLHVLDKFSIKADPLLAKAIAATAVDQATQFGCSYCDDDVADQVWDIVEDVCKAIKAAEKNKAKAEPPTQTTEIKTTSTGPSQTLTFEYKVWLPSFAFTSSSTDHYIKEAAYRVGRTRGQFWHDIDAGGYGIVAGPEAYITALSDIMGDTTLKVVYTCQAVTRWAMPPSYDSDTLALQSFKSLQYAKVPEYVAQILKATANGKAMDPPHATPETTTVYADDVPIKSFTTPTPPKPGDIAFDEYGKPVGIHVGNSQVMTHGVAKAPDSIAGKEYQIIHGGKSGKSLL